MTAPVSRRALLGGAMTAAAVAAIGCAPTPRITRRRERRRVVVVGTGFGGAVTALRLAEAGVEVTLLERGRRWASGQRGTFPTMLAPDHRASWLSPTNAASPLFQPNLVPWTPYTGLIERVRGKGMDSVCAAAVGGGSLPYHGMSVQPRGDLFDRVMPDVLDYEEFDRRWYPLAGATLGISAMPEDVLASDAYRSSRRFAEFVRRAGLPAAQPVPMPIDWDVVRAELRGELPRSISAGDVIYGVNGPGKRSLDTNYLPAAEATGRVELLALHDVRGLRRDGAGRWVLDAARIDTAGTVREHVEFTADAVVLSAGSTNTTKLLVTAAGRGEVSDLPEDVGAWWSTNGDLLTTQVMGEPMGTLQGGPANMVSFDWDDPAGPVTLIFAPIPIPVELNVMETIGIFIPDGHGRFDYDGATDTAQLTFPRSAHGAALDEARRRVARVAAAGGSRSTIDQTAAEPSTYHPLGGAVIGRVCDPHGRVLGQPGLYVNDGALIPGSTACANPSLTIAALAERNAADIVARDVGVRF